MTQSEVFVTPVPAGTAPYDVVVAIPVKNEAERIEACLRALAAQVDLDGVTPISDFAVLLFINNSDDETQTIARRLVDGMPYQLIVVSAVLPPSLANAGGARRSAMEVAATRLDTSARRGVLMTTDADSRVQPDWIARNLAEITNGVDAVAGTIALEPEDEARLPAHLKARGALEARYERLVCELHARLAPEPHDPWPRHPTESGATLAVTLDAYNAVGGLPPLALGEDRAFVGVLRDAGFKVRHSPSITVITSGRLVGRAAGGCADTMKQRIDNPVSECDAYLEPAIDVIRRYLRPSAATATPRRRLRPRQLRLQIVLARLFLFMWTLRSQMSVRLQAPSLVRSRMT